MDAACVAACGGMDTDAHMGNPDASLRTWTGTHQAIGDGTGCIRLPAAQQPVAEPEVNCIYLSSYARAGGPWAEERGMAGAQHRCGPKCTIRQEFGNVWRCMSSGKLHICDATCEERIAWGPNECICRISRRVTPLTHNEASYVRRVLSKRSARDDDIEDSDDAGASPSRGGGARARAYASAQAQRQHLQQQQQQHTGGCFGILTPGGESSKRQRSAVRPPPFQQLANGQTSHAPTASRGVNPFAVGFGGASTSSALGPPGPAGVGAFGSMSGFNSCAGAAAPDTDMC